MASGSCALRRGCLPLRSRCSRASTFRRGADVGGGGGGNRRAGGVARPRFELGSRASKAPMLDRYTIGLRTGAERPPNFGFAPPRSGRGRSPPHRAPGRPRAPASSPSLPLPPRHAAQGPWDWGVASPPAAALAAARASSRTACAPMLAAASPPFAPFCGCPARPTPSAPVRAAAALRQIHCGHHESRGLRPRAARRDPERKPYSSSRPPAGPDQNGIPLSPLSSRSGRPGSGGGSGRRRWLCPS